MKHKGIVHIVILVLVFVSIYNIYIYIEKRKEYNEVYTEYIELLSKYEKDNNEEQELEIGNNKERYFREQYNISKDDEILFKFPEDNDEISSS